MEYGLVDIAEPNPESRENVQDFVRDPTRMADLDDQRILVESRLQLPKVFLILRLVLEGPWKLDQYRPKSICFRYRSDTCFEIPFVLRRQFPLMREGVEQLSGEAEVSVVTDAGDPLPRCPRLWRTIVGGVDLDCCEVRGDIGQFVKAARGRLG
jgi:hypothetical protein